jgi:hypothetical protein
MLSAKYLAKIIFKPKMSLMKNDTHVITYAVKVKRYNFGKFTFK